MGNNIAPNIVVGGSGTSSRRSIKLKKALLVGGVLVLVALVIGGGYAAWRMYNDRKKGIINANTYPWPKTEKGADVQGQIKNMNNRQKAEYFYNIAFEFKNTGKPDDALAAAKVSLQYEKTEKALVLAANVTQAKGDYDAAIGYYKQLVDLLKGSKNSLNEAKVVRYEQIIKSLQNSKNVKPAPQPSTKPSEISA